MASDGIGDDDMAAAHGGDTYNPIDPAGLADRLSAAGFERIDVRTNDFGWAAIARR
ncbi:hypothetical protein [Mycobacterium sp. ENV421]|uniref:hypothetical protein n=1 Tax=Mycobacterium sp. ENV421 TaxID=1213407 RepID=UPI0018EC74DE|nr:hypothetical protein [Mycobacterium sp. ENV421]